MISNLENFNPQWVGIEYKTSVETRLVFDKILQTIESGLITFLIGPRRVGKSTLLKQVLNYKIKHSKIKPEQICFFEFEPSQTRSDLDDVLTQFFLNKANQNEPFYLFFDEIQFVKDYELSLKYLVDQNPNARIMITGSLSLGYKRKMAESLAGRILPIRISPLCFEEYLKLGGFEEYNLFKQNQDLSNRWSQAALALNTRFQAFLKNGTYPQAIFWPSDLSLSDFLETIVNQSLNQDAQAFFSLDRPDLILALFKHFAMHNGSEISLNSLASQLGANQITIRKYIDILESLGLINIVKNTADPLKNPNSKVKIYVNSVFENSWVKSKNDNLGPSVENYVLERLLDRNRHITFFRERDREVDFINHNDEEMIEVKYRQDIENLNFDFLLKQAEKIHYSPSIITLNQVKLGDPNYKSINLKPACFI